jgi:hypothetical protein
VDGVSIALCLVPCLAFTVGALAVGTVLGVQRAATLLGAAWVAVSVVPALIQSDLPAQLSRASLPWWGVAAVLAAAIVLVRGRRFAQV